MTNYEKGEWRLNNYHHPYQYIVAHGGPEDNDAFPGQRKICDIWDWNTERGKTNAHLIVSIPTLKQQRDDLLDACKKAKTALNLCARVFLGTGETPEPDVMADAIIEIDAAIANCEKEPA